MAKPTSASRSSRPKSPKSTIVQRKRFNFRSPTMALAVVAVVLIGLVSVGLSQASGPGMSLSPSSGSYAKGQTFAVSIYENGGGTTSVNAAQVNFKFPTSNLEYVKTVNSSAFPIVASGSASGGVIKLSRGTRPGPGVIGRQLVATVYFRGVASSKNTLNLSLANSAIVRTTDAKNILSEVNGATYTIK